MIERFGVYLAPFEPTVGAEMGKTRPCVIISPDQMNDLVRTVIVAPMTGTWRRYPYRVDCTFDDRDGQIALDQMRAFDKVRLIRRLGRLDNATASHVKRTLLAFFR